MLGARRGVRALRGMWITAALACGAGALGATSVQASFYAVSEAPAGNSSDPANPGRDLTAAGISYQRSTGTLVAAFRLAGTPTADQAFAGIFVGTRSPQGCNLYPAAGFSAYTSTGDARWARLDSSAGGTDGRTTVTGRGQAIQKFEVQDDRLKGLRPNCAIATLTDPGNATNVFDSIGPLDLIAEPELGVELKNLPEPFTTGRSRQVSVVVRNAGDAETGRLKLRLRTERGVKASPGTVTVKSIKAGGKRTVKVRVTPTARAKTFTQLTAIVGKAPIEARTQVKLWHRKPSSRGGGGGGGGTGPSRVCNRWLPDMTGETGGSLTLVPC